jgi:IS1 family transposase
MSRLSIDQKSQVVGALVEGSSIRSVERQTGVSRNRIGQLVLEMGRASERLLDETIRGFRCEQLELDEMWMFIRKRRNRVRTSDPPEVGDAWLWVGIDADSKLVPAHHIGKRQMEDARAFTRQLRRRVEGEVQLNTDRLGSYRAAILGEFSEMGANGLWIRPDWATVVKHYEAEPLGEGRYAPPRCTSVDKRAETGNPDMERATTSHVEAAHLHFRMRNKRAARLGNAFSKSLKHLTAATAMYYAHYNLVRRHYSIKTAPAVAAGLIDRPWTLRQLVECGELYGRA